LGIFADPPNYNFTQYASPPVSYKNIIVNVENEFDFHKSFNLSQNFPNPFNPYTIISYQVAVSGKVELKVFDVLGNEVATLVNEEKPSGSYEIKFYPGNLTSGTYFYQIRTNTFIETKKMILK
jgi:hypothetical protein